MNATKFIIAAGFALATTGAFAETSVSTYQGEHVSNVYGRASTSNAQAGNAGTRQAGKVADSGRDTSKEETKIAVTTGNKQVVEFGRS